MGQSTLLPHGQTHGTTHWLMTLVNQDHHFYGSHGPTSTSNPNSFTWILIFLSSISCFHFTVLLFWLVSIAGKTLSSSYSLGPVDKNKLSFSSVFLHPPLLAFLHHFRFVWLLRNCEGEKIIREPLSSLAFISIKSFFAMPNIYSQFKCN